jgi:flagellar basal-body rod protein FlgB
MLKKSVLIIIAILSLTHQQMVAVAESPLREFNDYMQFLAARDKILSENLANADTPNYKPKELTTHTTSNNGSIGLRRTHQDHFAFTDESPYETIPGEILEMKPNGNAVTVEHELTKKKENSILLSEVVNIYNRARSMNKTALTGVR